MDSNLHPHGYSGRSQARLLQQHPAMAGLMRFPSAPSSFLDGHEFIARSAANDAECVLATLFPHEASQTQTNLAFPQNQALPYQNFGYAMDYVAPSSSLKTSALARHCSLSSSFDNGLGGGGAQMRMNPISELGDAFEETWDDLDAVSGSNKGHLTANESELQMIELQESAPFKTRAKRGCATHPRSIAERVRRTRISERMRKLQELVPNMHRQTNTADMLDFAVDYIKELQEQVKVLSDTQAKCLCSNMR